MAKRKQVLVGPQSGPDDRRRQEKQWRELLEEQSRSGLTQREFCRRRSVPEHRLAWWKREIAIRDGRRTPRGKTRKSKRDATRSLIAVKIKCDGMQSAETTGAATFEIVLRRGHVLRVPPQFDEESLVRLLRCLESGC